MNFELIEPKSLNQKLYIETVINNQITFATGLAGTGKTFIALASAIKLLFDKSSVIDKIVVLRPLVKTNIGEAELGTLPGDVNEKIMSYFGGIHDNLVKLLPEKDIKRFIDGGKLEFTALSLCRGRSFERSFVIVDEAQNLTVEALKMILSRIHDNSKLLIVGDLGQTDLKGPRRNDLDKVMHLLGPMEGRGIGFCELYDPADIMRSKLISEILNRLDNRKLNG